MIQPWIDISTKDVRISPPMSIFDGSFRIMFRSVEVVDETIRKLEELKNVVKDTEILNHV